MKVKRTVSNNRLRYVLGWIKRDHLPIDLSALHEIYERSVRCLRTHQQGDDYTREITHEFELLSGNLTVAFLLAHIDHY